MRKKNICIGLAFLGLGTPTLMAQELKDDPAKEWCYLKKSTTVLGMPYNPQVTEVTYDGALYTGYIELNFAAGSKAAPLLLRQKTFLEGWIPVVGDTWKEDGLELYHPDVWSSGYARGYFQLSQFCENFG